MRKNTPRSSFVASERTKQSSELNPAGLDRPALILGDKERAQQQNVPSTQTPLAVSEAAGEFCIKSLHLFIYLFMCVPVLFILGGFGMHQLSKMMHGFLRFFFFFRFNLSANRWLPHGRFAEIVLYTAHLSGPEKPSVGEWQPGFLC